MININYYKRMLQFIILVLLLTFASNSFVLFDLINHFKPTLFVIFIVVSILLFFKKYEHKLWIYLLVFLLIFSYSLPQLTTDSVDEKSNLSILHINLFVSNMYTNKIFDMIEKEKPDIISFQEANAFWMMHIKSKLNDYDLIYETRNSPFGICVATKKKVDAEQIIYFNNRNVPAIECKIDGTTFVFIHPKPPITNGMFYERNDFFDQVIQRYKKHERLIVVSDFNITQWSPIYQNFEESLNLKNTISPFESTWSAQMPISLFQIDHILISNSINNIQSNVMKSVGSDHYPIMSRLKIN